MGGLDRGHRPQRMSSPRSRLGALVYLVPFHVLLPSSGVAVAWSADAAVANPCGTSMLWRCPRVPLCGSTEASGGALSQHMGTTWTITGGYTSLSVHVWKWLCCIVELPVGTLGGSGRSHVRLLEQGSCRV